MDGMDGWDGWMDEAYSDAFFQSCRRYIAATVLDARFYSFIFMSPSHRV